jgi:hypothetical protein
MKDPKVVRGSGLPVLDPRARALTASRSAARRARASDMPQTDSSATRPQRGHVDIRSHQPADPANGLGRYLASGVQDVCTQGNGG